MRIKTIKVYQVINEFGYPAHEEHLCIFRFKKNAKDFILELKGYCDRKFTIKQRQLINSEGQNVKYNR